MFVSNDGREPKPQKAFESDVDGSGDTGAFYLANLLGAWGTCNPGDPCECLDADSDGLIGAFDLAVLHERSHRCGGVNIGGPSRTSDQDISRVSTLNPSRCSPVCYTRPHDHCIHGDAIALLCLDLAVPRRYVATLILSQSGKRRPGE